MNSETINHNHWIIDNEIENEAFLRKKELTLTSIDNQVKRITGIQGIKKTGFYEKDLEITHPSNEINIPFTFEEKLNLSYWKKTQNWIGVVEEIDDEDMFRAKLIDKTNKGTYEFADFHFDEVSDSDKILVKIGGVFYFSLGLMLDNGQVKNQSFLRFKRSVPFNSTDVDDIENQIEDFENNINWE